MNTFKRAKVVMLPTNQQSKIFLSDDKTFISTMPTYVKSDNAQHLYIISDDEIKEGDWCMSDNNEHNIRQCTKTNADIDIRYLCIGNNNAVLKSACKKIIATTDTSLKLNEPVQIGQFHKTIPIILPQPSQSFIQVFIEEYNKGNVITDVMVEYENFRTNNHLYPEKSNREFDDNWLLKINPKDNTITIRKIKDNWNREEVRELIVNYTKLLISKHSEQDVDNWIKNNL